jgi:putative transposase
MVVAVSGQEMVKRQRGHKARLELTGAQVAALDEQGSAAITVWNCLHAYWTHFAGKRPTLAQADAAIRQARTDVDFLAVLPAQAAQAVLKTYVQAWENFFNPDHPAKRPTFKTKKGRPHLAVDVPQARNLRIVRLSAKWGAVTVPLVGRVRFRWTKALPGIGLLERGEIDFRLVGRHRRVRFDSVMEYRRHDDLRRREAVDELLQLGQDLLRGWKR